MFAFFKNMFAENDQGPFEDADATLKLGNKQPLRKPGISALPYRLATGQSTGMARAHNEDTLFTFSTFLDGLDNGHYLGIFLVADGMGGHQSGEIASQLAARGASQYLLENIIQDGMFSPEKIKSATLREQMQSAVEKAQQLIRQQVPGGGTTLTLALVLDDHVYTAHVGDSRLYLVDKEGDLQLKTKDHSLVKRLVDLGEITAAEAAEHPQRNVLYRALGQSEDLSADVDDFVIEPGEKLVLCSDGLWGVMSQEQLNTILSADAAPNWVAEALVAAANEAGGPDNVSVILVERI
ncbi:MAG: protein phosphatase 2C domain-containing protein [Chloroflexota bacterium]|nr:protein phosphatase 2C domain-containing protein [Chloroflexota bacterium]